MALYVEKIIMHNRAPFEHLELSFDKSGIVLLNAYNGGGKTTILSHIVDAFYEMARPYYTNEFEDKQNKLYRVSSQMFNTNPSKPSFVYIRFKYSESNGGSSETIDYVDVRDKCTEEEYNQAIDLQGKIPFSTFSRILENNHYVKKFSNTLNKEKVQRFFNTNILTYFPVYRFEYPGYLNDSYKDGIKFDREVSFSGYLTNPIEVITDMADLTNWMMDVLLDWQVNKTTQDLEIPSGTRIQIDTTPEKRNVWDILNKIIDLSIEKENGKLRLGIGKRVVPGQRISIMLDSDSRETFTKYPSIFNISTGEMSVITLFGEILRQADNIGSNSNVSGVVLIDEIDDHLHIKIQKEILPQLMNIFPNIQFIISSHSPFVAMGLSEKANSRFSLIHLSNKTGAPVTLIDNPLYEEVYQMMVKENENYKKHYELLLSSNTSCKQLLVEDKYDQIYKIAWLKLKNIPFSKDTLEIVFKDNAPFEILSDFSASGVAGCLSVKNPELFSNRIIVGLFDFDKEGTERFYNLKEGFVPKSDINGDLESGFYRKKITSDNVKMFALILPIPERLHYLISRAKTNKLWEGNGNCSNFVEIETLLKEDYLKTSSCFVKDNICGNDYYVAKDNKKQKLWEELLEEPRDIFLDFIPLFKRLYELFELGNFVN